ncbi:MAG: beta strand repeat-containing protein, partial [Planctomycetota bacterium]
MSLQDTLKQIRRQLAAWIDHHQRLRRRKLNVVRLEDRRLPDATFALIGNALTLDGFDGSTDSIDVAFDSSSSRLNFTLNSGDWLDGTGGPLDPALNVAGVLLSVDLGSLLSGGLSLLQIDGGTSLKNVTDSGTEFSLQSLVVSGESDVVLDSANDFDFIDVTANSLTLKDSDELQITGFDISMSADITAFGDLTSSDQLLVGENFSVSGNSIVLTEANEFGSLTFQSTGNVTIFENGSMLLTGSSSANSIELQATDDLADGDSSDLSVTQHARFSAESVSITGSFDAGSLSFHASNSVEIHELDGMEVSAASEATATLRLLAGNSLEVDGTIDVTGNVTIESGSGGDIVLNSKLTASGLVQVLSSGGIEIKGELDLGPLTLQSNNDVDVSAAVAATGQIAIEAGHDGTGSFTLQVEGSLFAGKADGTAGIAISAGATSGTISIAGSITADSLTEITTSDLVQGSGLIRSNELAIRAGTGIGSSGTLNTQVSSLAFRNTSSGDISISNTGALVITGVGSVDGTEGNTLGNTGGGTISVMAASPLTIDADVTSVGSISFTAGETVDAPGFADDLYVSSGVTVSVTGAGAALTLRAGDDIIVQGLASAANGNVVAEAGASDLDGEGAIHFDGQINAGQQVDLIAITGIHDDTTGSIIASSLRMLGGNAATLDNGHNVSDLAVSLAGSLTFRNNSAFNVSTIGTTSGILLTQTAASLELTASAGTIGLSSGISTQGHQTYFSAVELNSNQTIESGSGNVTFISTVNSAAGQGFGLFVNSSGQTRFLNTIGTGTNQELGFLTTDGTGTTVLTQNVKTTGEQNFGDAVSFDGNVTLSAADTDLDGEGIEFGSAVTGSGTNLTLVGGAGFAGSVSGVGSLAADHIDSESTIHAATVSVSGTSDLGGNVTTAGEQRYSNAVLLTSSVTLSAADTDLDGEGIEFGSAVTGSGTNLTLVGGAGFAGSVSGV